MTKTIKELAVELTIEITDVCDTIKGRAVFVNQLLRSCFSTTFATGEHIAVSQCETISRLRRKHIAHRRCISRERSELIGSH